MSAEKPKRNERIVKLIGEKNWSFEDVRKEYKFKTKGTVWGIWRRNKDKYLVNKG